uniref:Uncharacterized protein n=1 Tax=Ditylenchus dipsaci TaxID=166011 RepID=A0A915DGA2_9BILA
MASKNLIYPSAYFLRTQVAMCPLKTELLPKIQKEYQIYEYFTDIQPKYLTDMHWEKLFNECRTANDRVKYFKATAVLQHKEENDVIKRKEKFDKYQGALEEEMKKYGEGGMGYGPRLYELYRSPTAMIQITLLLPALKLHLL